MLNWIYFKFFQFLGKKRSYSISYSEAF